MPKKIFDIRTYSPQTNESFIMDACVLIHLFTDINSRVDDAKPYDTFFYETLIQSHSKPWKTYITTLILSEVVNSYIRVNFNNFCKKEKIKDANLKKHYRTSDDYSEKIEAITATVKDDIMPRFIQLDDGFGGLNIDNILTADTYYDFNDKVTAEVCRSKDITLITDDSDFGQMKNKPKILTANSKLLRFKS